MALITAPALIISPDTTIEPHHPLIGCDNKVTFGNLAADSEAANYPVTNLANPLTVSGWRSGSTAAQVVEINSLEGQTDYVGIARHNLGSTGCSVAVWGITAEPGAVFEELLDPVLLADDAPAMLRFAKDYYVGLELRLVPDGTAPQMAVLFAGALLAVRPGIQPGYVPLPLAVSLDVQNGRSQSGEYLGAIVTGAALGSPASFRDMEAGWFDSEMRPFIDAANYGATFFWAWAPTYRPNDVAYAFLAQTAQPPVVRSGAFYDLDLSMGGVAT